MRDWGGRFRLAGSAERSSRTEPAEDAEKGTLPTPAHPPCSLPAGVDAAPCDGRSPRPVGSLRRGRPCRAAARPAPPHRGEGLDKRQTGFPRRPVAPAEYGDFCSAREPVSDAACPTTPTPPAGPSNAGVCPSGRATERRNPRRLLLYQRHLVRGQGVAASALPVRLPPVQPQAPRCGPPACLR